MSRLAIEEVTERAAALRAALAERVVIADGAMGTMLQASDAILDDFDGHEGCNEVLNVTRPDIVSAVHRAYFDAGADCVTTNTFGANLGNLGEYGISDRIAELSQTGALLARPSAAVYSSAALGPRLDRPGNQAAHARPRNVRRAPRRVFRERGRPAARRCGRADHRDLPGPPPGEGRDYRC